MAASRNPGLPTLWGWLWARAIPSVPLAKGHPASWRYLLQPSFPTPPGLSLVTPHTPGSQSPLTLSFQDPPLLWPGATMISCPPDFPDSPPPFQPLLTAPDATIKSQDPGPQAGSLLCSSMPLRCHQLPGWSPRPARLATEASPGHLAHSGVTWDQPCWAWPPLCLGPLPFPDSPLHPSPRVGSDGGSCRTPASHHPRSGFVPGRGQLGGRPRPSLLAMGFPSGSSVEGSWGTLGHTLLIRPAFLSAAPPAGARLHAQSWTSGDRFGGHHCEKQLEPGCSCDRWMVLCLSVGRRPSGPKGKGRPNEEAQAASGLSTARGLGQQH